MCVDAFYNLLSSCASKSTTVLVKFSRCCHMGLACMERGIHMALWQSLGKLPDSHLKSPGDFSTCARLWQSTVLLWSLEPRLWQFAQERAGAPESRTQLETVTGRESVVTAAGEQVCLSERDGGAAKGRLFQALASGACRVPWLLDYNPWLSRQRLTGSGEHTGGLPPIPSFN